jgi:hypothetical protein
MSAAAGAALMGLIALLVRSGTRSGRCVGRRSAMAAIRDAALDLADSAQSMAEDALDATHKRASAAIDATRQRAASRSARRRSAPPLPPTRSPSRSPTRGRRCAIRPRR